ncbi:MAG: hypothetical protein LBU07_01050 [Coriobacteriales bacterium]|jgi:hypothetical protein|nr:hypothetical protein [Coriobacteriales bacterium]
MAQRNPMNDRYAGSGPAGKTRKSAAKLKPKAEAASSVHIEKKPVTKQERKAAHKKREAQLAAKERERQQKAAEREQAAKIAAGEQAPKPTKPSLVARAKSLLVGNSKAASAPASPRPTTPDTPEYRRYRRIYWVLLIVGVSCAAIMLLSPIYFADALSGSASATLMGIAYACIIGAIVIDYAKVRKLRQAHERASNPSRKSPKQLKHEERKTLAAKQLEEARKAQRNLKRAGTRLPLLRKSPAVVNEGAGDEAALPEEENHTGKGAAAHAHGTDEGPA